MEDCKGGFPHSEITGSKGASASPVLIAACHVLHRLSTPRHPSEALQRLIVSQQNSCRTDPTDWKEMPVGSCLIFVRQCLLSNRSSKPMRGRTNSSFTISMPTTAKQPGQSLYDHTSSWWSRTESNRRHPACKAGALPTELRPHSTRNSAKPRRACRCVSCCFQSSRAGRPGQTRTADLTLIRRAL